MTNVGTPTIEDLHAAATRISGEVERVRKFSSSYLNHLVGADLHLYCENLQKTGSFKYRGASNAVMSLDTSEVKLVLAHSSGNHGAAVARAAKKQGLSAMIIMPDSSAKNKIDRIREYGAEITFVPANARDEAIAQFQAHTECHLVHPFENRNVIAGQGTWALEALEDLALEREGRPFDIVMAPIGGGGLVSGTSIAFKSLSPQTEIFGAEPEVVDDAFRSLRDGVRAPAPTMASIGDGLNTRIGETTFAIISHNVSNILTVSEGEIIEATKLFWSRLRMLIEPSSAVVLAAALKSPDLFRNKKVALIFSGGNVDIERVIAL